MNNEKFELMHDRFLKGLCPLCAKLINPLTKKKSMSDIHEPVKTKLIVIEGIKMPICFVHPTIRVVLI